jgi:hypothetical protein
VLFRIPLFRELALWAGSVDAGKAVASRMLREGKSLGILVSAIQTLRHGKRRQARKGNRACCSGRGGLGAWGQTNSILWTL